YILHISLLTLHAYRHPCFPSSLFFFLTTPRPPKSTLFPYTTLFRSICLPSFAAVGATSQAIPRDRRVRATWSLRGRDCSSVTATSTQVGTGRLGTASPADRIRETRRVRPIDSPTPG